MISRNILGLFLVSLLFPEESWSFLRLNGPSSLLQRSPLVHRNYDQHSSSYLTSSLHSKQSNGLSTTVSSRGMPRMLGMVNALEVKKRKEDCTSSAQPSVVAGSGTCSLNDGAGKEARRKLRVLVVVEPTPFSYVSGYANRFKEMLYYLKKAGDEVHILAPDLTEHPPTDYLGFPITTIPGYRLAFYKAVTLSFGDRKIRDVMESFKPDLVHVSTPGTVVVRTISAARKMNVPIVMSYHTHLPAYAKKYLPVPGSVSLAHFLVRSVHQFADLTLVTSPELKAELQGFGVKRVAVWEKGVNTEVFNPNFRSKDMRNKMTNGNPDSVLMLYVGRLGIEKNLHLLKETLDSFASNNSSKSKQPRVSLALVGHGPQENELKELFKTYPNVHFAGQLTGKNLSEAFASADIFVLPSESETLGFVVLEAMASGVAPVAVAAGGVPGLIQHNVTGLLCDATDGRDGTQFTAYVKELVENTKLRKKVAKAARKYAESLSWEFATNKLRSLQYPAAIEIHKAKNRNSYFYPRNETREHEILHELHEREEVFDDKDI